MTTTTNLIELVERLRWQTRYTVGIVPVTMHEAADALEAKALDLDIQAGSIEAVQAANERLSKQIEALQADAERFQYIKDNIRVGAVETQLPLNRVHYWYGYETAADYDSLEAAIDAARKGNV